MQKKGRKQALTPTPSGVHELLKHLNKPTLLEQATLARHPAIKALAVSRGYDDNDMSCGVLLAEAIETCIMNGLTQRDLEPHEGDKVRRAPTVEARLILARRFISGFPVEEVAEQLALHRRVVTRKQQAGIERLTADLIRWFARNAPRSSA